MRFRSFVLAAAVAAAVAGPAGAQSHAGHGGAAGDSAATREFRAANARMHRGMDIRFSGDADKDFVAGMIAHHQGAIDMAKVVLRHGKDPEIRRLAEGIVAAQEQEIAQMKAWQARQK